MTQERTLHAHLQELEKRLSQPEVRRSARDLRELLAEDFREFGSSGRVFNRQHIIEALQNEQPWELSLDHFQAVSLASDLVLVTYRGTHKRVGAAEASYSLRSSIWRLRDGKWQAVFHQGTMTREAA